MNYLDSDDIERIKRLAGRNQGSVYPGSIGGLDLARLSVRNPACEFAEHRGYNPGESTRFIDWKVYARKEEFYIKDFLQERNSGWKVFFDVSASMGFPDERRRLFVRCALYACGMLLSRGEKLDVYLLNEKETVSRTGLRGLGKITILDEIFSFTRFSGGNFPSQAFSSWISSSANDSGMALFSDLLFPPEKLSAVALAVAKTPGKKYVFHFFDEDLGKFLTPGAEMILLDSETGEELQFEYPGFKRLLDNKRRKWADECRLLFSSGGSLYSRISAEKDFQLLRIMMPVRKR